MYVEAILMHFVAIMLLKLDLLDRHDMKLYSNVFQIPPPKYEQLFRPLDMSHQTHNLKGYIQNLVKTPKWFLRRQWLEVRIRIPSLGDKGYGSVSLALEARDTDLYP